MSSSELLQACDDNTHSLAGNLYELQQAWRYALKTFKLLLAIKKTQPVYLFFALTFAVITTIGLVKTLVICRRLRKFLIRPL